MKHINQYVRKQHGNAGHWTGRHTTLTSGRIILAHLPIEDVSPVVYDDLLLERGCHLEVRRYDQ